MEYNKKGGVAFIFIYGLAFLMGLGIIYIVFNQVVIVDFNPVIENQIPDDSVNKQHIIDLNNTWLSYWAAVPFLLVITVLLYWFVNGIIGGRINQ